MRDRLTTAILDAAAEVISEHGEAASMADVADTAGISRATLYRYFASRDELLEALTQAAINDASERLTAADLDHVPVAEALARIARAMVACGTKFSVIIDDPRHLDSEEVVRRVGGPIRAVLVRGVEDGTLRGDLPVDVLGQLWGGLLTASIRSMSLLEGAVERASAAMSSVFLEGAKGP